MTASFEKFKGGIKNLSVEDAEELIRELLLRRASLGLDAEIDSVEAILPLIAFIKDKIHLLPPCDKKRLFLHLRRGKASREPRMTAICAHCWSPVRR